MLQQLLLPIQKNTGGHTLPVCGALRAECDSSVESH
jgi:hypothetical protein